MKTMNPKNSARSGDGNVANGTGKRTTDGAAHDAVSIPAWFRVKCPNPACGEVHSAQVNWAGKKGKCPDCGAALIIPNVPASGATERIAVATSSSPNSMSHDLRRANAVANAPQLREPDLERRDASVREVGIGCIGRGHAGKTALFRALDESSVGGLFASGLHVDASDPREVAKLIHEAEQTRKILQQLGLPATLQTAQIRYCLFDRDEQRVAYNLQEVIGQVLTQTFPDSAPEQQSKYKTYIRNLVNTHVLWAVVPCLPPNSSTSDRRRYANDLRITLAYLREALRLRSLEQPVAVALVISKIDVLFEDAQQARAALTDEVLCESLAPLVRLLDQSARVSDAVIVPVSAFGFGNAILCDTVSVRAGASPESAEEPLGTEPTWLLRENAALEPFNLDSLFLWTLLVGLLNQGGPGIAERELQVDEICRTLRSDLDARNPWLVSIKGSLAT